MKKLFFLFTTMLVAVAVSAQTDFSGSWKLNSSKSTLNDQFSMAPKEIIISQAGNDLTVEKHSSFQGNEFTINDKFTLDGQPCINQGWRDSEKKSTAVWDTDKKSVEISSTLPMQDGGEMNITELYQLNAGNLILDTNVSSSYGDISEKMVFDKQ